MKNLIHKISKKNLRILILILSISTILKTEIIHEAHLSSGWYPQNKEKLEKEIKNYLSIAKQHFSVPVESKNIKALIVPHAGTYYSGLCAASGYQTLLEKGLRSSIGVEDDTILNIESKNKKINNVIILAPSHTSAFKGVALPDYTKYKTTLGILNVSKKSIKKLGENDLFKTNKKASEKEHSIEIQLPFLQCTIEEFSIVPLIIGQINNEELDEITNQITKIIDDKTLIVISSDFVHHGSRFGYNPFTENILHSIRQVDSQAIEAITKQSFEKFNSMISRTNATICGQSAIKILLKLLEQKTLNNIEIKLGCYYTSPQLEASKKDRIIRVKKLLENISDMKAQNSVSYASLIFSTKKHDKAFNVFDKGKLVTGYEKLALLNLARQTIQNSVEKTHQVKEVLLQPIKSSGVTQANGAFVTLNKKNGNLRGCIGRIVTSEPLYKTIMEMAKSASFHDSRFSPLKKEELTNILIDITILSKPREIENYKEIELGKHGIILNKNHHSSVYLPQVATGQGWNLETTLQHLSQKAGLKKDAWKKDCSFKVFEGLEFKERS